MDTTTSIRPVQPGELEKLVALIRARLPDVVHAGPTPETLERRLAGLIQDGCLIAAIKSGQYAGVLALDLYDRQVIACYLDPALASAATPRKLFDAVEQRALAFGLRSLQCCILSPALSLMWQLGYVPEDAEPDHERPILVRKDLLERADRWVREIFALHDELGITEDYGPRHHLEMVRECQNTVSIGFDAYDREQWMETEAAKAWKAMRTAANRNGVRLQVVSAYRGLNYQAGIIRNKLEKGQNIHRVLSVSAAPGFSEHHSGRALDLKTPGEPPLEESFGETAAYRWLSANARLFGFRESFGRNNRHGLAWEPWHWCYHPASPSR
ncbi:MAG: M15 family metallopeptidase [Wenzhouxiangella sp.]|jgi:D-alanyl-D-alanine carboxypeptidase|nr:M15 family metallopeptidase [Wenzhouxiangella sp.]